MKTRKLTDDEMSIVLGHADSAYYNVFVDALGLCCYRIEDATGLVAGSCSVTLGFGRSRRSRVLCRVGVGDGSHVASNVDELALELSSIDVLDEPGCR